MKKALLTFACPKLAFKLVIQFSLRFLFLLGIIVLIIKFGKTETIIAVMICSIIILNFLLWSYFSVKKCGYGIALFKCFIITKINENSLSNCFCKLNCEEISYIGYEHIHANHKNSRYFIRGDFGIIVLISKDKSKENKNFRQYSSKDTICLPLNEKTKEILAIWGLNKTGDGCVS